MALVEKPAHGPDQNRLGMEDEHLPEGPYTAGHQQGIVGPVYLQVAGLGQEQFHDRLLACTLDLQGDHPHFQDGIMPVFCHLGDKGQGRFPVDLVFALVADAAAEFDAHRQALLIEIVENFKAGVNNSHPLAPSGLKYKKDKKA